MSTLLSYWKKSVVSWTVAKTLYISVPFTWLLPIADRMAREHKGKVVAGGPAVDLVGAPWANETPGYTVYDVLSIHNPFATFTTRGCLRHCSFCAVPQTEGAFRELDTWKPAPIVCDNNLLAASKKHFERVVQSLLPLPFVDFNQGLDHRLLKDWHIDQMRRLNSVKIRFAFDCVAQEAGLLSAIKRVKRAGFKDIGVYVLIGFNDTPQDALYRLELVRSLGVRPNPMRYQPPNALQKNSYVAPGWTELELRRTAKYYSCLRWLDHIPFADYCHAGYDGTDLLTDAGVQA